MSDKIWKPITNIKGDDNVAEQCGIMKKTGWIHADLSEERDCDLFQVPNHSPLSIF